MPKITLKDFKDALVPALWIFGAVWLAGKLIEHNVDVEKNWQEYIDSKQRS